MAPDEGGPRPSRTRKKKDSLEVFELGCRLVELSASELDRLPLDDRLREAVETGQRLHQRGARKRQLKLIAALMREAEPEAIREAVEALAVPTPEARAEQKAIERWRAALLEEGAAGDAALTRFFEAHPEADRQQLRQLQRAARKPSSAERGKKAARALYQRLAELLRAP